MIEPSAHVRVLSPAASGIDVSDAERLPDFLRRLDGPLGDALEVLFAELYGRDQRAGDAYAQLISNLGHLAQQRSPELRALDRQRGEHPDWFQANAMLGYLAYADRFAGGFSGVAERLDWLQQLGVRYLHLLPFTRPRQGDNDGGFAVADYDDVDPRLGTVDDLLALTKQLRAASISLGSDLVLNHTADDHAWALAAKAGDPHYRDFYLLYPDRSGPDQFEPRLPQIFPMTAPGNFTWVEAVKAWVWTTFYPYQWDLNWANPHVFVAMAEIMMRAANRGIEVFRLDSTAFLWKRAGTSCMNQPEVHQILRAFRLLTEIFAPAVLLKAEAIVPMRELPPYFGKAALAQRECHLAYQSSLMAAAWASLSRGDARLLQRVLADTPTLPAGCSWLTYVRCHDDIGWSVLQGEARGDGSEAPVDLGTIAAFFSGQQAGSFAEGEAFQTTGHGVHGSNGMTAALCGVQRAEQSGDPLHVQAACARVLLMLGLMLSVGGLPMLYMGDEIGLGNDHSYRLDPERLHEGRWLHRPKLDWQQAQQLAPGSAAARIRHGLQQLIEQRQSCSALHAALPTQMLDSGSAAVLMFQRGSDFVGAFNFSAAAQHVFLPGAGPWQDRLSGQSALAGIELPPWSQAWLVRS